MDGFTLTSFIQKIPNLSFHVQGHLAKDTRLKKVLVYPALFVLNTDVEQGPGKHWCIILIFDQAYAEFFDSFGKSPAHYGFAKELLRHVSNIRYNEYAVQSKQNGTCGHHCIFWLYHRARDLSPDEIMKTCYTRHTEYNDLLVYNFVKEKFNPS